MTPSPAIVVHSGQQKPGDNIDERIINQSWTLCVRGRMNILNIKTSRGTGAYISNVARLHHEATNTFAAVLIYRRRSIGAISCTCPCSIRRRFL